MNSEPPPYGLVPKSQQQQDSFQYTSHTTVLQPSLQPITTSGPTVLPAAYPGLGIAYFIKTPSLWVRVIFHLFVSVILVVVCIILLLSLGIPFQAKALEQLIPTAWAWVVSIVLVVVESAIATLLVGLLYLQAFALDDIFDRVMAQNGHDITVNKPEHGFVRGFYRFLHPILYMFTTLLALPLNLIPILGQFLFLICCAYFVSWGCHLHYFDLKCMTWSESRNFIKLHWKEYFAFGYVGGMLEAIPVAGLFFMMTNVIGAALWAAHMEEAGIAPEVHLS
jgi:uncharacterized protein involved in cysteine biosynthesis